MNNEQKEKLNAIIIGHCDIFGNIINGTAPHFKIIAIAPDAKDRDIFDALFYEETSQGEKKYGVATNVITYENKVCWQGGSVNWLDALDGYRHFQYKIGHDNEVTGLRWHSLEYNALLDLVGPVRLVSSAQVSSLLNNHHDEYLDAHGISRSGDISILSFDLLISYAMLKLLYMVIDEGRDIDTAWYIYRSIVPPFDDKSELEKDLERAVRRASEIYEA